MRRVLKWLGGLLALGAVAAVGLFAWFVLWPVHTIPALEPVDEYVWLDQGWGHGQTRRCASSTTTPRRAPRCRRAPRRARCATAGS